MLLMFIESFLADCALITSNLMIVKHFRVIVMSIPQIWLMLFQGQVFTNVVPLREMESRRLIKKLCHSELRLDEPVHFLLNYKVSEASLIFKH